MKKIFYYIIAVVMIVCLAIVPVVAADEGGESFDGADVVTEGYETVGETIGETAGETGGASPSPTETEITESETESEDLAAIIEGADSKLDAIFAIASAMGITPEEAEAFLDKMVSLGDEHFGESDLWADVKASIAEDPEAWTVAALVVLMFVALVVFLIRGLIKNTTAQAATKANIIDIKKNEAEISDKVSKANARLGDIEREHSDIKSEMDEIREMAIAMLAAVDSLKSNSESALKVNEEQALQTVQLLNIAMGRQMPRMSETTRKAWYDESVAKIKEAAGIKEPTEAGK